MPSSEQENGGALAALNTTAIPVGPSGSKPGSSAPFRFHTPRVLIDWRALQSLDVCSIVRDTDLDALERVLDLVAFGDIEAEDARNLTPHNFIKLFRVAQLTVDYLLHVQDRLAADSCNAKGELARMRQQLQSLQVKIKEQREELAGSRKEAKQLKKALRTLEALALARQQAPPPPPPEVRVVERVVEVPDAAATRRLEKLEDELDRVLQERQELQSTNAKLADALAAATAAQASAEAGAARALGKARQEEREAADARLQAALEEERRQHSSKAKLSVVVTGDDSPDLRSKLAAAQRREQEAERRAEAAEVEVARAVASAGKAAAAPAAEVRRLRTQLESAQAEVDMLRSRLAQRERERSPSRAPAQGGSGLGTELEDVDDARIQQLEAEVEALQVKLASMESARSKLAVRCQQLEQQLQQAQLERSRSGGSPVSAEMVDRAAVADVLEQQVAKLREDKAVLKEECHRLRQQAAADAAEIEHLRLRLQQVAPASSRKGASSGNAQGSEQRHTHTEIRVRGDSSSPAQVQHQQQPVDQQAAATRGGIGSPIEEPAAAASNAHDTEPAHAGNVRRRPGSSPGSARSRRRAASSPGSASPKAAVPSPSTGRAAIPSPSAADREQFRREMLHTLRSAERPGVVSRFSHSLGSFLTLRCDLEAELEAELAAELETYGLDPAAQHLSDRQYFQAMAELGRRRAQAREAMSPEDRRRADYMRSTASWHLQRMAELASGQREASPVRRQLLTQAPSGLKPIRTVSKDAELSPRQASRGFVGQVLERVGDEAGVYSPLQRGASVLSDRGYLSGEGDATPRSITSTGPLVPDGAGTPRSPWAVTHDRVFHAALELESGAGSPLRHAASLQCSPARTPSSLAAGSAAASPTRQPRGGKSVQFVQQAGHYVQHLDASPAASSVAAQRMGRRPAAAGSGRRQHGMYSGGSEIEPAGGDGIASLRDSRDLDTGDAAPVRPVPRRVPAP